MFAFIKKLFGIKPQVDEPVAPYKVETPLIVLPPEAEVVARPEVNSQITDAVTQAPAKKPAKKPVKKPAPSKKKPAASPSKQGGTRGRKPKTQ